MNLRHGHVYLRSQRKLISNFFSMIRSNPTLQKKLLLAIKKSQ